MEKSRCAAEREHGGRVPEHLSHRDACPTLDSDISLAAAAPLHSTSAHNIN